MFSAPLKSFLHSLHYKCVVLTMIFPFVYMLLEPYLTDSSTFHLIYSVTSLSHIYISIERLVLELDNIAILNKDNSCNSMTSLTLCIFSPCNSGELFELCLYPSTDFTNLHWVVTKYFFACFLWNRQFITHVNTGWITLLNKVDNAVIDMPLLYRPEPSKVQNPGLPALTLSREWEELLDSVRPRYFTSFSCAIFCFDVQIPFS